MSLVAGVGSVNHLGSFDRDKRVSFGEAKQLIQEANLELGFQVLAPIWESDFSEMDWLEIIKLCFLKDPVEAGKNIQQFNLQEPHRFEIVKFCARQFGWKSESYFWGTELHVRNFKLDEGQRFEIAMLCAQHGGELMHPNQIDGFSLSISSKKHIEHLAVIHNYQNLKYMGSPWETVFDLVGPPNLNSLAKVTLQSQRLIERFNLSLSKMENPERKKQSLYLAAATLFLCTEYFTSEEVNWLASQALFEAIFAFEVPHLQPLLLQLAVAIAREGRQQFERLDLKSSLLKLPLALLQSQGVVVSPVQVNEPDLKNMKVFSSFLEALGKLVQVEELSAEQKTKVVDAVCKDPAANGTHLLIILNFGQVGLLQTEPIDDLTKLAAQAFTQVIPLSHIDGLSRRYESTFRSYRHPEALMIYAANLKKLQDPKVMESLGEFTSSVLTGTYLQKRYDFERNPHLQQIQRDHPALFQAWRETSNPISVTTILSEDLKVYDVHKWLKEAIVDYKQMDLEYVAKFLTLDEPDKTAVEVELRALLQQCHQAGDKGNFTFLTLQKKCIQLVKSAAKPSRIGVTQLLKEIVKLPLSATFKKGVEGMIQKQSVDELIVIETEDPQELFLSGMGFQDSCQQVDGNPVFSKGLLGLMMHGQTRMIAVKNKIGRLVARRILRLLLDGQTPILFLEPSYACRFDLQIERAMVIKAKQVAQRLFVPLTAAEGGKDYGKPLQSLGGMAPFEYVDGAKGMSQGGEFTILHAAILFEPVEEKSKLRTFFHRFFSAIFK
jgi:hypothetical protein